MSGPPGKRRRMAKFTINELSGVDYPAQAGAQALILKRRDPDTPSLDDQIAAAVKAALKQHQPEGHDVSQKELDTLKAQNERLEKIVSLDATTKAYFDAIDGAEAQDAFLAKSPDARKADMDEAERKRREAEAKKDADDPVVYTTKAGIDIRKSDGPATLALAKQADKDREELAAVKEENAALKASTTDATYEKRAETEIPHLPGTVKQRAAMIKAIDAIEDKDDREAGLAALKAQNEKLSWAFKRRGVSGDGNVINFEKGDDASDAQSKLDELAKAYQKEHEGTSFAKAQAKVLETAEGVRLYDEIDAAKRARAAGAAA